MVGVGDWPDVVDYSSALQNPHVCFADGRLFGCQATMRRGQFPLVYSGNFAAVYRVSLDGREFAIRCFVRPLTDQMRHYSELSAFLQGLSSPIFVPFEYLDDAMLIRGTRYPVLKMEWVDGETLDRFVGNALDDPGRITALLSHWRAVLSALRSMGIAHNSLDHQNILVTSGGIRLVDYDGIYLPTYQGLRSPEEGHSNYQHPLRTLEDYSEDIDNFPALVIYLSLLAVSVDPGLWRFNSGRNLILQERDYQYPGNSECIASLRESSDDSVRSSAGYLEQYCSVAVGQVPDLKTIIAAAGAGEADAPMTNASATQTNAVSAHSPPDVLPAAPVRTSSEARPRPAPASPPPGNAGAGQSAGGGNPAFGGRVPSTFRPRLLAAQAPDAPSSAPEPAVPAKVTEEEPQPVATASDDAAFAGDSAVVPGETTTDAVAPEDAEDRAATDADNAATAKVATVIFADDSTGAQVDVAALLSNAASASTAAAKMAETGWANAEAGASSVIVIVVNEASPAD